MLFTYHYEECVVIASFFNHPSPLCRLFLTPRTAASGVYRHRGELLHPQVLAGGGGQGAGDQGGRQRGRHRGRLRREWWQSGQRGLGRSAPGPDSVPAETLRRGLTVM